MLAVQSHQGRQDARLALDDVPATRARTGSTKDVISSFRTGAEANLSRVKLKAPVPLIYKGTGAHLHGSRWGSKVRRANRLIIKPILPPRWVTYPRGYRLQFLRSWRSQMADAGDARAAMAGHRPKKTDTEAD